MKKQILSLLMALVILIGILPVSAASSADASDSYKTILNDTLAQLVNTVDEPSFGTGGGEWTVMSIARAEFLDLDDAYFEGYYNRIVETVNSLAASVNKNGALHSRKLTENSRLIIALSSIGKKADTVGNWNILAPLEVEADVTWQGINGPIFALIALDTYGYETADTTIRQKYIDYILSKEITAGGWALFGSAADPDITSMAIQALAPYYNSNSEVKSAVDRAIAVLSNLQSDNGGYESWGSVNAESIAQVIVACTALGIDPERDSRFVKNGISAVDALLEFYDADSKMFRHIMTGSGNGMATDQAAYALVAYDRLVNGKTSLYDMSDVLQKQEDKKAAGQAEELIASIGEVTKYSRDKILAARNAYNSLSAAQKALVNNLAVLTAAEEKFAALQAEQIRKENAESQIPVTGDSSETAVYILLMAVTAAAAVILLKKSGKHE